MRRDGDLSRWMQWLMTSHVRRHHRRYRGSGHLWQGRFKAFPVQNDDHFLTVARYIECNPVRAELVHRAEMWRWSSAWNGKPPTPADLLSPWPFPRPRDWLRQLREPQTAAELAGVRHSIARGAPFGDDRWRIRTAARLGLESSLNPRGRPPKSSPPRANEMKK